MRLGRDAMGRALAIRLASAVLILCAGCQGGLGRRAEHDSSGLLDTGGVARVSRRQAADVEIAMGKALEESGDLAGAEASYRNALKKAPRRADAEGRLAVLADERGDLKESAEHFDRALKLTPNDPDLLCDRGYSYYLQRRWSEAEACLRKSLANRPRNPRAHNNLGLVLARRGDRDEALAEFLRAGCDRADAQSNLALVLATEGRLEDARALYALAAASKPNSDPAREGLHAAETALAARGGGTSPAGATTEALAGAIPPPARFDPAVVRTSAPRGY